jgi:DNA-binding GntR family transcriptional regulator
MNADLDFHRTLCSESGNATLLQSWQGDRGLDPHVHPVRRLDSAMRNMDFERHTAIIEAVRTRDGERASATLRDHVPVAAQTLIS